MGEIRVFFGTVKIRKAGNSLVIYLDNSWPVVQKEVVGLSIRRADLSDEPLFVTKKVAKVGHSAAIYLNREWGFHLGEIVSFYIERREIPKEKNSKDPRLVFLEAEQ